MNQIKHYLSRKIIVYLVQIIFFSVNTYQVHAQVSNDDCINAIPIEFGDTITYNLQNTIVNNLICEPNRLGNDIWYSFIGTGEVIKIKSTIHNYIPKINILTGNCEETICRNITTINRGEYNFQTIENQFYWLNIAVRQFNVTNSTLELTIDVISPPINDTYLGAIPLSCSDTLIGNLTNALTENENYQPLNFPSLWYKITGTGNFYIASTGHTSLRERKTFYTLNSNELEEYTYKWYPYLEQDSIYYLNISFSNYVDNFPITLTCHPIVENDICRLSTDINLSDTIRDETVFSLNDEQNPSCYFNNPPINPDFWYQFEGDGGLYQFTFNRPSLGQECSIFKGNCDSLICIEEFVNLGYVTSESGQLLLEQGANYYIKVYNTSYHFDSRPFEFYFNKLEIAPNDICEGAKLLSCGDVIIDSLDYAITIDTFCSGYPHKGIWYQYEGTGKYVEFNFVNTTPITGFSLFEGNCNQLVCAQEKMKKYTDKYVFFGEVGRSYYLAVGSRTKFEFDILCYDKESNNVIENATSITCGERVNGYGFLATKETTNSCPTSSEGKDLWWKFEGNNQFIYVENLASSNYGQSGFISSIHILKHDSLYCLTDFTGRILTEKGTTYYLRYVLSDNPKGYYDYDLQFNCVQPSDNDNCNTALSLICGDTITTNDKHTRTDTIYSIDTEESIIIAGVWIKISGDGTYKKLSGINLDSTFFNAKFNYFRGSCEGLTTVPQLMKANNFSIFYAETGVDYYVVIHSNNNYFNLALECADGLINDYCHQSIAVSCGDTISTTLNYAQICDYGDGISCNGEKRIWYKIEGDGNIFELTFNPSYYTNLADLEIFYDNCCQKQMIPNIYGTKLHKYFLSKPNETYLIGVSINNPNVNGDCSLIINCLDEAAINICENSVELDNKQPVQVDLSKATPYYDETDSRLKPTSWASFIGSGGIDTLIFQAENLSRFSTVEIFIDEQKNCQLSPNVHLNYFSLPQEKNEYKILISTLKDSKYLVAFKNPIFSGVSQDTINISLKYATNSVCKIQLNKNTFYVNRNESVTVNITNGIELGITDVLLTETVSNNINYSNVVNRSLDYLLIFTPESEGLVIIRFITNDTNCWGHGYFYIKYNDPIPIELECPDSTIICSDGINHASQILNTNYFKSNNFITSSAIITRKAKIIYSATQSVNLRSGFHAEPGSSFTAKIEECSFESTDNLSNQNKIREETISENNYQEVNWLKTTQAEKIDLKTNPNPFQDEIEVNYFLPKNEVVTISLYHLNGQHLRTIVPKSNQTTGFHQQLISTNFLNTGIYIIELLTPKIKIYQKIVKVY